MTRFAWVLTGLALLIGFITRPFALLRYVDFDGDQARDAYLYANMQHGFWPTLGPPITGENYYLPPLYYYLVFPFTLLGPHPALQALPNALLTLLSIPLVGACVHRLLSNLPSPQRLLWASIGALWWSVMLVDIMLGTREWNPSPIVFFMLAFTLIAAAQLRNPSLDRRSAGSWALLGVLLAFSVSLHATTLYVMPPIFIGVGIAFIARSASRPRAAFLVFLGALSACLCLTPYWLGELHNHWQNTHAMLEFSQRAANGVPFFTKFQNAARAYGWLDGQCYFIDAPPFLRWWGMLFLIVSVVGAGFALKRFRGDRVLLAVLAAEWIVFLFAAAQFPATEMRYRLPITPAPLFLAILAVSTLGFASWRNRTIGAFLASSIVLSIADNAWMDTLHQARAFSATRFIAASDLITAFDAIPTGSLVCDSPFSRTADRYLDEAVTHRALRFVDICMPGTYAIHPRFVGATGGKADFVLDYREYDRGYLRYVGLIPSSPFPLPGLTMQRNEALTLLLINEGQASPLR